MDEVTPPGALRHRHGASGCGRIPTGWIWGQNPWLRSEPSRRGSGHQPGPRPACLFHRWKWVQPAGRRLDERRHRLRPEPSCNTATATASACCTLCPGTCQ